MDQAQIQAILNGETRLLDRKDFAATGGIELTRMWPDINKADLPALTAYLAANPVVTDPRIEGQTFAGTFWGATPTLQWGQHDPHTPDGGQSTLNLVQQLFLANVTTAEVPIEKSCRYTTTAYTIYAATTLDVLPAPANGITYELASPPVIDGDGVYRITILKKTRINQTETFISEVTSGAVTTTALNLGTTATPAAISPAAGEIKRRSLEKNADCTMDVQDRTEAVIDQTITRVEVRPAQTVTTTIHTQQDVASLPTNPPVPGDGEFKTLELEPSDAKDRVKTTLTVGVSSKLEVEATVADYDGDTIIYEGDGLTLAEVTAKIAAVSTDKRCTPSLNKSREFKDRYSLRLIQRAVNENASYGDAFETSELEYEVVDRRGVPTKIGLKWTTSNVAAKNWITAAPTDGYTTIKLDVDGVKTFPNPLGRGRFFAVRVWQ